MPKSSSVSKTKWLEVSRSEESVTLDVGALCQHASAAEESPIDEYYDHAKALLLRSVDPSFSGEQALMRLLLLGAVSLTENYFRRVLAGLVVSCPVAREHASSSMLALGAVYYYPSDAIGYALIEGSSMSGSKEVKAQTRNVCGIDLNSNASVDQALRDFDKVCHLRHAAVHSYGELGARNVREMGMSLTDRHRLHLTPLTYQSITAVCHNAVRAYNRAVYTKTIDRWLGRDVLTGEWHRDKEFFAPVYRLFYSQIDKLGYSTPYWAHRELVQAVLS